MAKTFVIGIGGTGSRVIRALMALMASGADTNDHDIIPILIDVDKTNKDTEKAFDFVNSYVDFRNKLYGDTFPQPHERFLRAKLDRYFNQEDGNQIIKVINETGLRFREYIGYDRMAGDNESIVLHDLDKDFIDSIFNTYDKDKEQQRVEGTVGHRSEFEGDEELALKMSVGFKGHPNIGVIIFNNIKNNPDFVNLLNLAASSLDNRIFLISSIFGGTGASGFPQILNLINDAAKTQIQGGMGINSNINNVPVAALTVFPYFSLETANENGDSSINANTFMSKSKAALYYYENQLDRLNIMYKLFDQPKNQYKNNSGGREQENSAHWVELIGAQAIIHFCYQKTEEVVGNQKSYAFFNNIEDGINDLPEEITYSHFFDKTQRETLQPLIKMGLLWYLLNRLIPHTHADNLRKNLELHKSDSKESRLVNDFRIFVNDKFRQWVEEIQKTSRKLKLFVFDTQDLTGFLFFKTISNTDESYNILKSDRDTIEKLLMKISDEIYDSHKNSERKKINAFLHRSVEEIFSKYKF